MAASRVACASFNIGTNTTIAITRDESTYKHTLTYKFGSATGTIATKTDQTSIVWSPAAATLYAQIPNAVRGYGTITCQTYDGDTLIGTTTTGFYASAVKENCLPAVSAVIEDTNAATIAVTGNKNKLVCYISKPKVTMTATAKNSASIKSRQITNPVGLIATTSPYTFDTVYSDEFRIKATDSRGYSTEEVYNVGFVEYVPAFIESIALKRLESTSTTAEAVLSGYCFKGNFGAADNTLTLKYRYKTDGAYGSYVTVSGVTWNADGTFSAKVSIPNLSLAATYIFEFVVQDKLTSFINDEVVLGQGTGDLRIGKDYIQAKNTMIVGDLNNEEWKCFKARRKVGGNNYASNFGTGRVNGTGAAAVELYQIIDGVDTLIARTELRPDGHLYNLFTAMSFAEIMASAPSIVAGGAQGYLLINGGDSSPIMCQWGRVNITPDAANVTTSLKVNFLYPFQGIPFVVSDKATSAPATIDVSVGDITTTGFSLYLQRTNTVTTSVVWFAIGNGGNALPE